MKYYILTIFVFFNIFDSADASKFIDILVPYNRVSINKNNIIIIGKTDAAIVDVFLNEKLYDNILVVDSFFHLSIDFGYGLHEIKVIPAYSGMSSSETEFKTIEVMYAPMISRKYKRLYPDFTYHSIEVEQICLNCHELDLESLNEVDESKTCLDCHISLKNSFSKHTKGDNKTCLMCHQFDSNLIAIIDKKNLNKNPCFQCHEDKIKSFDQKYVHGPIAAGSCNICHSMHGSDNDNNLNYPEDMLCFKCHDDVEEQVNVSVVHKPFIEGKCSSCHDPHSTNNAWILKKKSEVICMSCHDKEGDLKEHSHPFNVAPKRELQNNLILTPNGELECLTCHNPHSSKNPYMLKTSKNSICVGCHTDIL